MAVHFASRLSHTNMSAAEMKLTENTTSVALKISLNATLQLISYDRFKKVNTRNLKDKCTTHFCI